MEGRKTIFRGRGKRRPLSGHRGVWRPAAASYERPDRPCVFLLLFDDFNDHKSFIHPFDVKIKGFSVIHLFDDFIIVIHISYHLMVNLLDNVAFGNAGFGPFAVRCHTHDNDAVSTSQVKLLPDITGDIGNFNAQSLFN